MDYLVAALCVAVLGGECSSLPTTSSTYKGSDLREKSPVRAVATQLADCEPGLSQQQWRPLAYAGPTAVPVLRDDGTIAETPEVAAARAAHLTALEVIRATNPDMDDGHYDTHKYGDRLNGVTSRSQGALVYNSYPMGNYGTDVEAVMKHQLAPKMHGTTYSQAKASAGAEADLAMWKSNNAGAVGYSYNTPAVQHKPYTSDSIAVEAGEVAYSQGHVSTDPAHTTWGSNNAVNMGYSYNTHVTHDKPYTSGAVAVKADEVAYSQGQVSANPEITTWRSHSSGTLGSSYITPAVQNKPYISGTRADNVNGLAYSQEHPSTDPARGSWRSNNGNVGYSYSTPVIQNTPYVSDRTAVGADELAAYSQAKASAEAALAMWKAKSNAPVVFSYGSSTAQNKPYLGPLAVIQLLSTGYLADTPEVAAAKRLHLNAVAEARAAAALWKAKHPQAHHNDQSWN